MKQRVCVEKCPMPGIQLKKIAYMVRDQLYLNCYSDLHMASVQGVSALHPELS